MPVFRHASCGSEWIYVNLGDTYWLNHNHRKLWIANQIKSAQAIVLNASISGVIDMTTTNTPNDNNTRQNTACIENCWINTHPPFRKPYRKNTQINQQWHLQNCWKFHLIEPKLFGPILLSKRRILPIPWPHLSLSLLLKKKRPTQPWFTFFSRIDMKHPVAKRELKLQHWNVQARLRLKPYHPYHARRLVALAMWILFVVDIAHTTMPPAFLPFIERFPNEMSFANLFVLHWSFWAIKSDLLLNAIPQALPTVAEVYCNSPKTWQCHTRESGTKRKIRKSKQLPQMIQWHPRHFFHSLLL